MGETIFNKDESKTEVVASDSKEKSKKSILKNTFVLRVVFYLALIFFIFIIGAGVGAYTYPRVMNWLENHNFVSTEEKNGTEDSTESSGFINFPSIKKNEESEEKDDSSGSSDSNVVDVVEEARHGVVSIAVSKLQVEQGNIVDLSSNIGSGFIVDDKGLIITNQHVVLNPNLDYKVVDYKGNEYTVNEVYRDDINDIALLSVNSCPDGKECKSSMLDSVKLGDSSKLKVGEGVVAIGTPLGQYAGSATTGIVSGLERSVTASAGGFWSEPKKYDNVIQTDAAINPGNSGGPLLNMKSEVIGVNFATTSGADNIAFALPINIVRSRLEEYRKYGKFLMPVLGVQIGDYFTEYEARMYTYQGYQLIPGAMVSAVIPGTGADEAGLQKGDIIIEVNGKKVQSSLGNLIQQYDVGEKVEVKYWRKGEVKSVKVELGER